MSLTVPPPLSSATRSPIERWGLDPHVVHLNHGSFGGCLRTVLVRAAELRQRLEAAPMRFFVLDWQRELDAAREALAAFVHAPSDHLVFVPGSTTGVALALHSIPWQTGDEIILTDHGYRACRNQVERLAAARGVKIVTVTLALPLDHDQVVEAFSTAITSRTRAILVDHVTSPTALILPVERLVALATTSGVTTIVDGAHAPGQLELDVAAIRATYYTGNCHKWMCAPKGTGFLAIAEGAPAIPLVTSHGASPEYGLANRLHAELDWAGTHDPAAHLSVPTAITEVGAEGGGWSELRRRNHALVLDMRRRFVDTLGRSTPVRSLAPDHCIGSMVSIPVTLPGSALALERELLETGWEVPIVDTPKGALVRLSAHLYNHADEAAQLARQLAEYDVRLR